MRRVINLDAQGREELMRATRETNKRFREIEEESAKRTGGLPGVGVRAIVLPASEEQIAEAEAAKARESGTPPL